MQEIDATTKAKLFELAYANKFLALETKKVKPVVKVGERGDWRPEQAKKLRVDIKAILSSEPIGAAEIAEKVGARPHRVRVILRAMLELDLVKRSGPANRTKWTTA